MVETATARFIPADKLTREQLDHHIWHDHHSIGPRHERGRRKPDKWATERFHARLHADEEQFAKAEPHTHDAVKTHAGSITKLIEATPGLRHGYWSGSGRVKGWGNWHEGLKAEGQTDGSVHLTYTAGSWTAQSSEEEQFARATEALEAKGYTVTAHAREENLLLAGTTITRRWLEVRKGQKGAS